MWEIISSSARITEVIGKELGRLLIPGDVVSLVGDLGAGKTVFVRGAAGGLDVAGDVSSPSFLIVQEYAGKYPLFHADFYRLGSYRELEGIGWDEYLGRQGVVLIEWGDRFPEALPADFLEVRISPADFSETARLLRFRPRGGRYEARVKELAENCAYLL